MQSLYERTQKNCRATAQRSVGSVSRRSNSSKSTPLGELVISSASRETGKGTHYLLARRSTKLALWMIRTFSSERRHLEVGVTYLLAHNCKHAKLIDKCAFRQSKC